MTGPLPDEHLPNFGVFGKFVTSSGWGPTLNASQLVRKWGSAETRWLDTCSVPTSTL